MSAEPSSLAAAVSRPGTARRRARLLFGIALVALMGGAVAGIMVGSRTIAPSVILEALLRYDPVNSDHLVILQSRVPRLALGLLVGSALGLAGLLMQSFTRNPLADPGLLGVNAGAAAGVVFAIAYLGIADPGGYVWFAFGGAATASVAVYLLGSAHRNAANPARMALAGVALSTAVSAVTAMMLASNETVFLRFRYWAVGTLQGRSIDVFWTLVPFVLVGTVASFALIRVLNALALGEDTARSLGANIAVARVVCAAAVVLLAGSATAAAGAIGFVGLASAHIVRTIVGPDHRLLVPCVLVTAPALLILADVAGRIAVAPGELQTGIAMAILGGPLFVGLVRSRRVVSL